MKANFLQADALAIQYATKHFDETFNELWEDDEMQGFYFDLCKDLASGHPTATEPLLEAMQTRIEQVIGEMAGFVTEGGTGE